MKSLVLAAAIAACCALPALAGDASSPNWSINATVIEACSCPMFCQCYFNMEPAGHAAAAKADEHAGHAHAEQSGHAGHGAEHYCRFNNAYKVNKGTYGATKLDGAKFWIYGDLGGDFSKGQLDWAVVTFDKATSKEQRDGIGAICAKLFPVKWNSLTTAEGEISWVAGNGEAKAQLDGGKTAEVALGTATLNRNVKADPIVIKNLRYWGAPRNDGFVLMPNVIEAVRTGEKQFEYKGTNGFMITIDMNSKDVMAGGGM